MVQQNTPQSQQQAQFPPGVEIITVGGTGEVGRNMTAVRVDDDVFIFDMGLHMPNYIKFTDEDVSDLSKLNVDALRKAGAIPNDNSITHWRKHVKAIFLGHGHLDHIGAVPFISNNYHAPIIGSPYTIAVLKTMLRDEKIQLKNKLETLSPNGTRKITKNVTAEFVHVTHSIPQSVLVALHTKYGVILYATDFKFDNNPVLGKPPHYECLKRLGDQGVLITMVDALYVTRPGKMPSEVVAREMLRDAMLGVDNRGKALVITTFSSHIARLKSVLEFGKQTKRKILFMGRSLAKYALAAEEIDLFNFTKQGVEILKYGNQVRRKFREIMKRGKDKFLLVVTGHQGEPKSMLSKMVDRKFDFHFDSDDHVIFSSSVIPVEPNISYRKTIEQHLQHDGVRLYTDIHCSGHAAREDIREFFKLTRPRHMIPTHAEPNKVDSCIQLWKEMGQPPKNAHVLKAGQRLKVA
ncbi:RNase J family beta-CASP ribonuclease [Candidatus Woesearchaeota archaeon]|nr:RNase J family beta-CASP ribonuclease [Candidatus Woesearchaeota archaeon]